MKKRDIDRKKYGGKYIATKSFTDTEIIASGTNPLKVYDEAKKSGAENPVIDYVPKEGMVCIF
jgi:hypothetical protein